MEMKDGRVLITKQEYDMLIKSEYQLQLLTKIMYKNAVLSWKKEELRSDSDALTQFMKAVDTYRYISEYDRLLEEKKEQEAKDREKVID